MSKTLGILGAGQLGSLLIEGGRVVAPDVRYRVWSSNPDDPALALANSSVVAPYEDPAALQEFTQGLDGVMLEFENVPLLTVRAIERQGIGVYPGSIPLGVAQDRWNEKQLCNYFRVPHAETTLIAKRAPRNRPRESAYPGFLKTCRDGYDGRGQFRIGSEAELMRTWEKDAKSRDCVYEKLVPYEFEFSVIVARDRYRNEFVSEPIVNEHVNNILHRSVCPSDRITDLLRHEATKYALTIAQELDLVGILAIEFFAAAKDESGVLHAFVNEIAPRPHNSGHGSIEAWSVSQFALLVQIALGMPIEPPKLLHRFEMLNLIGDDFSRVDELLKGPRLSFFHDYRKKEVRQGRKMGHITYINDL